MTPTNQIIRNIIRTALPTVVGSVLGYVAKFKAHLPGSYAVYFPVLATAYYSIVRILEEKFPRFSWLLGALPVKNATTK